MELVRAKGYSFVAMEVAFVLPRSKNQRVVGMVVAMFGLNLHGAVSLMKMMAFFLRRGAQRVEAIFL